MAHFLSIREKRSRARAFRG